METEEGSHLPTSDSCLLDTKYAVSTALHCTSLKFNEYKPEILKQSLVVQVLNPPQLF